MLATFFSIISISTATIFLIFWGNAATKFLYTWKWIAAIRSNPSVLPLF